MLLAITALNVYKPRGVTAYGRRVAQTVVLSSTNDEIRREAGSVTVTKKTAVGARSLDSCHRFGTTLRDFPSRKRWPYVSRDRVLRRMHASTAASIGRP